MKYTVYIFIAFLFSCTSKSEDKPVAEKTQKEKPAPKMEETFPFSEADKVEVISYPVRYTWDTIKARGGGGYHNLVKDQKLMVDQSYFKDKIILDNNSKNALFSYFFVEKNHEGESHACFEPRHSILFYQKDKIIGYIEVCFECGNAYSSFTSSNNSAGPKNMLKLKNIFQNAGIKYFGEGQY